MIKDIFDKDISIETERLKLRQLTQSDAQDIYEIFFDKEVMRYYDLLPFESLDRAKQQIDLFTGGYADKSMIRWGIELKESGKLIGTCGFFAFNEDACKAELGYELNRSYQGKGLMTEALRAVLSFIFSETDINRVEAYVEPLNIASQKLIEKVGFTKEGTLRSFERCRGELIDIIIYGCLRSDGKY